MRECALGTGGTKLPPIGLGCGRIGSFGNPNPMREIRSMLAQALDMGVGLFDTADVYGQGDSEREIGRALLGRRGDAFVVTKVGKRFSSRMRLMRPLKPLLKPLLASARGGRAAVTGQREANMTSDFSPAYIARALEGSLKRLGFDHVDALLLHSPSAAQIDAGAAWALGEMKRSGKARYVGISCDDMAALRAAMEANVVDLLELPLDVIDAAIENGLADAIVEGGIGVLAREVIRFQPNIPAPRAIANASLRQSVTSVIVGTSNLGHLREAISAVESASIDFVQQRQGLAVEELSVP
jgi:pyridoxine 4-dehydrogenase